MEKTAPHKTFIGAPGADGNCNCNMCPYMALNTMEKLYISMRDLTPRIEMDEELRLAAKKSLARLLEMAGRTVGKRDVGRPSFAAASIGRAPWWARGRRQVWILVGAVQLKQKSI